MPTHDQPIQVPSKPECPSSERLREYLLGKSDEANSGYIDRHLESCPACNQSIQSLESKLGPTWGLSSLRATNAADGIPNSEDRILQDAFEASRLAVAAREIPAIVGPYRLLKSIGRGGMGEVYQAEHTKLKKIVAIKLLPLYVSNAHAIERFEREIQAAGKLNHSAIVNSTDAGIDSGYQYLAMEFIEGLDLGRLCRCVGPISCADASEIGRQMALGLAHAHTMGMVHRDIKPSNVMLDPSGNIKLLDLGLVLLSQWDSPVGELTTVGQFLGTLDYMAPEQAERSGSVDHRSDLYSLGATLFRLLTGQLPIAMLPSQSPLEKLRALTNHSPIRIQTLRKDIPSELAGIFDQLLSTDPRHRPLSAAHVAQALEPFCKDANLVQLAAQAAKAAPLNLPPEIAPKPHPFGTQGRDSRKGFSWWTVAAAAFVPLLAYLGIRIILEDSSGNLVIQSDVDQVHVRLLKADGTPGKEWRVQQGNSITKLMAGNYEITIDSPSNDVAIDQSTLVVKNGETIVARIARQPNNATTTIPAHLTGRDSTSGEREGTAIAWLPKELRERPILDAMYNGKKIIDYMKSIQLERNYNAWLNSLSIIEDAASQEDKTLMSSFVVQTAQDKKFADGIRILRLSDWLTDSEMDARIVKWFSMSVDPHKPIEAFVNYCIESCKFKREHPRSIEWTKFEKTWVYIEDWLSKTNREGKLAKLQLVSKILAANPFAQHLFERYPRTAFAICEYYESRQDIIGITTALVGSERDRASRVRSRILITQEDFAQSNVEGVLRQLMDVDQQPLSIEAETEYWKVVSEQIGIYLNSWAAKDQPVLPDEIRLQLSGRMQFGNLQIPHHTVRARMQNGRMGGGMGGMAMGMGGGVGLGGTIGKRPGESFEITSRSFELLAAYVWIPEKFRPRGALEEVRKMLSKHLGDTSARVDELFPMQLSQLEWNDQYRLEKVDEKNKIESFTSADQRAVEAFVLHHSVNALLESDDQSEGAIVQRFLEDLETAGSGGNKPSASHWIVKRGRDTWSEKSLPLDFRKMEFSAQDIKTWINRATVIARPSQQVIPGMGGGVPIGFKNYSLKFELEWEAEGWRIRKLIAIDGSTEDVIMDF